MAGVKKGGGGVKQVGMRGGDGQKEGERGSWDSEAFG